MLKKKTTKTVSMRGALPDSPGNDKNIHFKVEKLAKMSNIVHKMNHTGPFAK